MSNNLKMQTSNFDNSNMISVVNKDKYLKENINVRYFLLLLNDLQIEEIIENYLIENLKIEFNDKVKMRNKKVWLRFLKRSLLNKRIDIMQFKISNVKCIADSLTFDIYMIYKNINGNLFFIEINAENNWSKNIINQLNYKITIN